MSFIANHKHFVAFTFGLVYLFAGIYLLSITSRSDLTGLMTAIPVAFAGFFIILFVRSKITFKLVWLLVLGILLRLVFLFEEPKLSDDYLRYLWDGKVVELGMDPYAQTPDSLLKQDSEKITELRKFDVQLHITEFPSGLNSYSYYSVYPPVAQLLFWSAVKMGETVNGSALSLKLFYLLFEIGTFLLLVKLLIAFNQNKVDALIYWFNPLVIAEFTGNLHLEGLAVFFLLLTFLFLTQKRIALAGLPLAMAVATKLIPLFLLGVSFRSMSFGKLLLFGSITVVLTVFLFAPITDLSGILNLFKSVKLYSYWFEYNAGIYYLLLDVHLTFQGNNIIGMYNFLLPVILLLGFAALHFFVKQKDLIERFFLIYLFYLLISRVVHPWYLIPLIGLAPFVKWRFITIWSFLIMFTYASFAGGHYNEVKSYMFFEYVIVYVLLIVEFFIVPSFKNSGRTNG